MQAANAVQGILHGVRRTQESSVYSQILDLNLRSCHMPGTESSRCRR